ncbi:hypothetical protein [Blautia marasmi]|uniref:hypothetical protein n=1 Tax=Blautia marasmi TaxID=1917868 RepID=UPI000CF2DE7F|nr:hypothetical protein [Blautia marasmi]
MHVLSIKPEMILYFYMASCLAVLVFNILYIFVDKYKGRRLEHRSLEMVDEISGQIQDTKEGNIQEAYFFGLARRLRKLEKLRAFEFSMDEIQKTVPKEDMKEYLEHLRRVFLELVPIYEKRDEIEQAYFASLVEKFEIDRGHKGYDGLMDLMIRMVVNKGVYVRENALKALYMMGNKGAVLAAWEKMEDNEIYHSKKLLSDGLLSFTGDRGELACLLFGHRDRFEPRLILPVMQFIRFLGEDFRSGFLEIMKKETEDKEIRLEAVRYFRKYPYGPAREALQRFLQYHEFLDWEYAAVAAQALASYPGPDTVDCLKEGLKAANWYVRLNCADALIVGLKIQKKDLFDVYNGRDRYAREILHYVTEKIEIKGQEMELRETDV